MEQINMAVIDLNGMNMFLGYKQLVKHNLEVNWNIRTIQFTRYLRKYKTKHQNIIVMSRIQKLQPIDNKDREQQDIEKELDSTNLENLLEYI